MIEDERLDLREPADLERLLGGGVDRVLAVRLLEKRRVVHQEIGTGDQRRIDGHGISRVGEPHVLDLFEQRLAPPVAGRRFHLGLAHRRELRLEASLRLDDPIPKGGLVGDVPYGERFERPTLAERH